MLFLCYDNSMKTMLFYLYIINVISLLLMGIDKRRAIKHAWRIPEKVLFISALIGGGVGAWGGMYAFHHKTKHWYFVIFMPLITIGWAILVAMLYFKGILTL